MTDSLKIMTQYQKISSVSKFWFSILIYWEVFSIFWLSLWSFSWGGVCASTESCTGKYTTRLNHCQQIFRWSSSPGCLLLRGIFYTQYQENHPPQIHFEWGAGTRCLEQLGLRMTLVHVIQSGVCKCLKKRFPSSCLDLRAPVRGSGGLKRIRGSRLYSRRLRPTATISSTAAVHHVCCFFLKVRGSF